MNVVEDVTKELGSMPDWVLVMVGLTLFGIYWKRSMWPNRWLKFVNLMLPTIVYPCIHYGAEAAQKYWNPGLVLAIHGFAIGVCSEFFHEGIITKLKTLGMKFPDEAVIPNQPPLSKTETQLLHKDEIAGPSAETKGKV